MVEDPIPVKDIIEAGAGQYTEITSIQAPEAAASGSLVQIKVTIKNNYSATIGIMVGGALEYGVTPWPQISYPTSSANVGAGSSKVFTGTFDMPAHDVTIHAYSYYYTTDGYVFDDEKTKKVGAWISLAASSLAVAKAGAGAWISLATASLSVKRAIVGAWISLATSSLSVKKGIVGAWISLAISSLSVKKGIAGGWVSLAMINLAVGVGIVAGQDIFKSLAVDFEKKLPKEFE